MGDRTAHYEAILARPNLSDSTCAELLRNEAIKSERAIAPSERLPRLVCQIVAKGNLGQTAGLSAMCQQALELVSPDTSQLVMLHLLRALADHEIRAQSGIGANALTKFERVVRHAQLSEFAFDARLLRLRVHMGDRSKRFVQDELEICADFFREKGLWLRFAKTSNSQLVHADGPNLCQKRQYAINALRASRRGGHDHHYALSLLNIVDIYLESNQLPQAHRLLQKTAQFFRSHRIGRNTIAFALFCGNRALYFSKSGQSTRYEHQYRKSIALAKQVESHLLAISIYQELADAAGAFGHTEVQTQALQAQIAFHKALAANRMDHAQRAAQLDDVIIDKPAVTTAPQVNVVTLSQVDALTQLPSRAALDEQLREITTQNQSTVFAFIDLNNFKEINDSLSHYAGDSALQLFARRLSKALVNIGNVYRWGGDEFFFVSKAGIEGEYVRSTLDECEVIKGCDWTHDGVTTRLTARVGTVQYPSEAQTAATVMRFAALTLQAAKHNTQKILHFKSEFREQYERSLRLKRHLSHLDLEQFTVEFQPIYRLANLDIVGHEALARWHHEGEDISPTEFIPLLMELNREHELLRAMLRRTVEYLHTHQDQATFCAINISPSLFCQPDFAERLLRDLHPQPQRIREALILEIVESESLGTRQAAADNAAKLKAAGLKLAIDDFGAGFSTMEQLATLPFDIIKIDKSFISSLGKPSIKKTILKSMIQLAKDTDKSVIIEGIENQQQLDIVRELGADCGQGFYLSND